MNIIITAGGTIEKIDDVRTINNMSTGKLGSVICDNLTKFKIEDNGIKRTLNDNDKIFYVHSKTAIKPIKNNLVEMIQITDTQSLQNAITEILNNNKIDLVIHSMAVSDYTVESVMTEDMLSDSNSTGLVGNKISSDNENIYLKLTKTPKIINMFKEHDENIFLVGFKLLSGATVEELVKASYKQIKNSGSDIVIANDLADIKAGKHLARFYLKDNEEYAKYCYEETGKEDIADAIENLIEDLKTNYIEVEITFSADWYDGPISGLCKYKNKTCFYQWSNDNLIYNERVYTIYELDSWAEAIELQMKEEFEKYIGFSYSYDYTRKEIEDLSEKYKSYRLLTKEKHLYMWETDTYKQLKKETLLYQDKLIPIGISKTI